MGPPVTVTVLHQGKLYIYIYIWNLTVSTGLLGQALCIPHTWPWFPWETFGFAANRWEVVMKAVQKNGSALMFASEELQKDKARKRVPIWKSYSKVGRSLDFWVGSRSEPTIFTDGLDVILSGSRPPKQVIAHQHVLAGCGDGSCGLRWPCVGFLVW